MKTLTAKELALYLGCECEIVTAPNTVGKLISISLEGDVCRILQPPYSPMNGGWFAKIEEVKPILRPLSDISANECFELVKLKDFPRASDGRMIALNGRYEPDVFLYLLSKHFDLFGWIEQNLAIDKNTLK